MREGRLTLNQVNRLYDLFMTDVSENVWQLIPVTDILLRRAGGMITRQQPTGFLRVGDAMHLLTAAESGCTEIWSNDRRLLAAAHHFGLTAHSV